MDAEHDVTEEGDEDEELQRLDGDGEEDEADDIVVGDPKESGQGAVGRGSLRLRIPPPSVRKSFSLSLAL